MGAIEIKMGGTFYGADPSTLRFIAENRKLITKPDQFPLSYWVIQLMLAGF